MRKKYWRVQPVSLRKLLFLFASISVVVAGLFISSNSSAQSQQQAGGSAIQISPTRNEVSLQPGEQKTVSLSLKNVSNNDITARVFLNDFESDNESGTPKIIIEDRDPTPYSLKKILTGYTDVELKANETKEVKVTINMPSNAAPGAYFGALRYAAVPKGQEGQADDRQVSLTASVAHLVFVEVPGNIKQQIQIQKVQAVRNNKPGSIFFKTPTQGSVTVRNLGNGFSRPFGKVTVNNPFGKQVHTYDVNNTEPRGVVLPSSNRIFTNDIKGVKFPGKYSMTASVAYGNGGEVVNLKGSFWYLPVWFVILFLVLIVSIAVATYILYRKRFMRKKQSRK
jgi:hypothetical protein